MKKLLFILITFLSFNLFAQPPGGGGQRGQNTESNKVKEIRKFSANDAAGIFYYDIDEVIKKIKVKDDDKKYAVTKAFRNYNFKIKEISFLNTEKFADLDIFVNSLSKEKDSEANKEIREKVREAIRPIKDSVHQKEKELNEVLLTILSEKQYNKWLKYQKQKVESLQPQKPQNNSTGSRPSRGSRMNRQ